MKISTSSPKCTCKLLVLLWLSVGVGAGNSPAASGDDEARATPKALVETEPVPSKGDAADDPAIWVHPDQPDQSLVLGTDKKGGLNAFDLEGHRVQVVSDGSRPNNVDVLYDFPLEGRVADLAVAGTRSKTLPGCRILASRSGQPATERAGLGSCIYCFWRWRALRVLRLSQPAGSGVFCVRHEQGGRDRATSDRSRSRLIHRRKASTLVPRGLDNRGMRR